MRRVDHDARLTAVDELLDLVGLRDRADDRLDGFTPGSSSWSPSPSCSPPGPGLLLADEPTSQLDHDARDRVLAALARATASSAPPSSS